MGITVDIGAPRVIYLALYGGVFLGQRSKQESLFAALLIDGARAAH